MSLSEKRGDSVKILFDCSYRDDTLMQYQSYIDSGKMDNFDDFKTDAVLDRILVIVCISH